MLTLICWFALAPVAAATIIFAIEMMIGLFPARRSARPAVQPSIAIVVPAHDEGAGIAATVAALCQDLPDRARLLVIADNCSDDTATIARGAGAIVAERHDPAKRGKGYALAYAREQLAGDPPDVAIVIDADCRISPGGIAHLGAAAAACGRPMQAAYLLAPRLSAGPMVQLSGFAFVVKNLVRQRGLARIGAPAILTGSGMAFPWAIFATAPLDTGHIVEDLAIGIALARRGEPPAFLADVTILSDPSSAGGTLEQRRRWEHGFLATARSQALPLLLSGRWRLAWLGLHLLVPPLALLMMIGGLLLLLLTGIAVLGGPVLPAVMLGGLLAIVLLLVAIAWVGHGRDQIRAATLWRIPLYMLWKLPIYASALTRREQRWIRTKRD